MLARRSLTDFENRRIATEAGKDCNALNISCIAAMVMVRWKFRSPESVRLSGSPIPLHKATGAGVVARSRMTSSRTTLKAA